MDCSSVTYLFIIFMLKRIEISSEIQKMQGYKRVIRPLRCASESSEKVGVCMFAWDCIRSNGTHIGTCVDRFYFGSCCQLTRSSVEAYHVEDSVRSTTREPASSSSSLSSTMEYDPFYPTKETLEIPTTPGYNKSTSDSFVSLSLHSSHGASPNLSFVTFFTLMKESVSPSESSNPMETSAGVTPSVTFNGTGSSSTEDLQESSKSHASAASTPIMLGESGQESVPGSSEGTPPAYTSTSTEEVITEGSSQTFGQSSLESEDPFLTSLEASATPQRTATPTASTPDFTSPNATLSTGSRPGTTAWVDSISYETEGAPKPSMGLNAHYTEVCGRPVWPTGRIVGGTKADFGEWPWQVSLREWREGIFLHKCGAALLNENWVITAAHCIENLSLENILLRLGEYDMSSKDEPYGFVDRKVQITATHPSFKPRIYEYDLALLRFYTPVTFQPNIIPICLPENDYNYIGSSGYVTGWGRLYEDGPLSAVLQEVELPVISNEKCEEMYQRAGYSEKIPEIFLCAGTLVGGRDSCLGDSGGPLVIRRKNGRWDLAGIISWGIGCAEVNQPGVYTRISYFREWISQIIQF